MGALALFFAGPQGVVAKWAVIALLVAAFGAFSWFKGNEHGTQKLIDYQGRQATEAVRINTARSAAAAKVVTKYVQVKGDTEVVTQTIEKEVIKYADSNAGFCLDGAWRVLHDRAAANAVPAAGLKLDAAGGAAAADPPGAPRAAEALDAVTGNYAACHRTADRLDALQAWVKAQAAVK